MIFARLLAILFFTAATLPASAFEFWPSRSSHDRLTPGDVKDAYAYLRDGKLAVAERAGAWVRMSPSGGPGYVVGVAPEAKAWRLIGYGTQARQPGNPLPKESGCSRPIDEALGRRTSALWGKALGGANTRDPRTGSNGEQFVFVLKSRHRAGSVWSPASLPQPRMHALSQVAESMFAACLTGKGLDALSRQMSALAVWL